MTPRDYYAPDADDGAAAMMELEMLGCWRCVYCGNVISSDPSPAMAACCGEVGHNERDDGSETE
ncbi:MAG: hypothetical protein KGI71_06245 [Patescibacteria group bacterium]|nr:hypothetical protein [Patescibacteria group bacterium]